MLKEKKMKEGDMVRFAKWEELDSETVTNSKNWSKAPKPHLGLLIKHDKLMQSVHVLHEGCVLQIRPVFVEKAGRKDFEVNSEDR